MGTPALPSSDLYNVLYFLVLRKKMVKNKDIYLRYSYLLLTFISKLTFLAERNQGSLKSTGFANGGLGREFSLWRVQTK